MAAPKTSLWKGLGCVPDVLGLCEASKAAPPNLSDSFSTWATLSYSHWVITEFSTWDALSYLPMLIWRDFISLLIKIIIIARPMIYFLSNEENNTWLWSTLNYVMLDCKLSICCLQLARKVQGGLGEDVDHHFMACSAGVQWDTGN